MTFNVLDDAQNKRMCAKADLLEEAIANAIAELSWARLLPALAVGAGKKIFADFPKEEHTEAVKFFSEFVLVTVRMLTEESAFRERPDSSRQAAP